MHRAGRTFLGSIAILIMVVVAYLPALNAGYLWDDDSYVVHNANLVRADGWRRIWLEPQRSVQYYPMVHTVLRAEYTLWQLHPFGYHLVNVLLHALNSILLWRILRRLEVPGAWFVASIFGLHPVHVESVAWITEIKNLLSGAFYFLAAAVYLRFHAARTGTAAAAVPRFAFRPGLLYLLSLLLFGLALLSKTTAVTLPVVLLVVLWWKARSLRRRDVLPLVPMFLMAVACGALVLWLETHHVGAENVVTLSGWERLLLPGRAAWFYAHKLWWPAGLVFIYPRWDVDPRVAWQWVFPLGVLAILTWLWLGRKRFGKGPLAAVLYFLLNLALVSGAVQFYFIYYSFVGDHFQYLASIGIIALTVAGARWVAGARSRAVQTAATRFAPALVLTLLAVCTWTRAQAYRGEETLWRDTIAKNPAAWIAHNNLGVVYMRQGRKAEAWERFTTALQLKSDIPEAHVNLAVLAGERGDVDRAIAEYRQAVALKPVLVDAQYDLGVLLARRGALDEAERHFLAAVQFQPTLADAHMRLGDIAVTQGQLDRALARYRAALALKPTNPTYHYRLGYVFATQESYAEARDALATAVRLNPADADAQALLGLSLEKLGDVRGARERYGKALELEPSTELALLGMQRLAGKPADPGTMR